MELSLEEIEAQLGETLPERRLMSMLSTSPATTAAMPAMPSDISTGPVDYTRYLQLDPLSTQNV
jgi:hypothetical protein